MRLGAGTPRGGPAAQASVEGARPWSGAIARIVLLGMLEAAA